MPKQKRIGLIYNYNEGWIGGTYYVENIVHALKQLDKEYQPKVFVYTNIKKTFLKLKEATNYPYLHYRSLYSHHCFWGRVINKISLHLFKCTLLHYKPTNEDLDFIYPNAKNNHFSNLSRDKRIDWIPDFQDIHLPNFFTQKELVKRKNWQTEISTKSCQIVFSSKDALNDFENLYPKSLVKKYVIPFAVSNTGLEVSKDVVNKILEKFKIKRPFFYIPNQLWVHKNHITVLRAISKIDNPDLEFIFSGKEEDYRVPDYPQKLKETVFDLKIEDRARFLGFISKQELNVLVNVSIAIIQPSLFEGWSTTIEEAKCYNKFIIASDINVHKEQLSNYPNKAFFKAQSEDDLKDKILESDYQTHTYDYHADILKFAQSIVNL
nr:glycosyltransferase [uncultured Carboxylicivirga sp.]